MFIGPAAGKLAEFIDNAITRSLDQIRIMRAVYALLLVGNPPSSPLFQRSADYIVSTRQQDGGWVDSEESAWAIAAIRAIYGHTPTLVQSSVTWLDRARKPTGGWGRNTRGKARITTTALVAALVPNVVKHDDITWLIKEWHRDFNGPVRLSYKAGFFLLAVPAMHTEEIVTRTLTHLSEDQNHDGGFGPWKNHPIGSDPWSTGVVLWGLSRWMTMVDKTVIHKALAWLERTQLPSGYWPYHYLDDGTSLALIGAVAAMKALASAE